MYWENISKALAVGLYLSAQSQYREEEKGHWGPERNIWNFCLCHLYLFLNEHVPFEQAWLS